MVGSACLFNSSQNPFTVTPPFRVQLYIQKDIVLFCAKGQADNSSVYKL